MKPRRIHSALRNRKWQIITLGGLLMMAAVWWLSHRYSVEIWYRFPKVALVVSIDDGTFSMGRWDRGYECFRQPDGFDAVPGGRPSPISYVMGRLDVDSDGVAIPVILVALAFGAIQYLTLPKSLPFVPDPRIK